MSESNNAHDKHNLCHFTDGSWWCNTCDVEIEPPTVIRLERELEAAKTQLRDAENCLEAAHSDRKCITSYGLLRILDNYRQKYPAEPRNPE